MHLKVVVAVLVLFCSVLLLTQIPPVTAQSEESQRVVVTNFPELQQVAGTVSVEGPVRHASLLRIKDVLVPPVDPQETGRLIEAGILVTDGFTSAVLSLNGQAKGKLLRPGTVGAMLIPEEDSDCFSLLGDLPLVLLEPGASHRGLPALPRAASQHERQDGDGEPVRLPHKLTSDHQGKTCWNRPSIAAQDFLSASAS